MIIRPSSILTFFYPSVAGAHLHSSFGIYIGSDTNPRLHRATWTSTELFLTFPPPKLASVTLLPLNSDETAGRFRVWLYLSADPPILLWDRKVEGGFPELKVLVSTDLLGSSPCSVMLMDCDTETAPSRQYTTWSIFGPLR
jgi:predicted Rdx family selenoprotein